MNLLAIETSGPMLSVAVKKGKNPVRQGTVRGYMQHVENLIPLIDRLLKKERLTISDIGIFLMGRGPGSFTGLRVGFATIKGFLSVRNRPCFGAYAFDLVASMITPEKNKNLTVCLNAKRDKLYARSYRSYKKGWKPAGIPFVVPPQTLLDTLPAETLLAGDGLAFLNQSSLKKFEAVAKKYWYPSASGLIALYEMKNPLLKQLAKPAELLPFYLRTSEAEERLKNISV